MIQKKSEQKRMTGLSQYVSPEERGESIVREKEEGSGGWTFFPTLGPDFLPLFVRSTLGGGHPVIFCHLILRDLDERRRGTEKSTSIEVLFSCILSPEEEKEGKSRKKKKCETARSLSNCIRAIEMGGEIEGGGKRTIGRAIIQLPFPNRKRGLSLSPPSLHAVKI